MVLTLKQGKAEERRFYEWLWDCRLITTDQGHLGMAPRQAMKGDVVAVLTISSVPVKRRESAGTEEYEVVGEVFMPGFMKWEAVEGDNKP